MTKVDIFTPYRRNKGDRTLACRNAAGEVIAVFNSSDRKDAELFAAIQRKASSA
jgi:hypothetical protein